MLNILTGAPRSVAQITSAFTQMIADLEHAAASAVRVKIQALLA